MADTNQEILEKILDVIDSYIYVSDLETDEILFINHKMKNDFGGDDGVRGDKCWKRLQKGQTGRCSWCKKNELLKNPDKAVIWEEDNPVSDKSSCNIDRIIDWPGGRKVHIQQGIDITESKKAKETLIQREKMLDTINRAATILLEREEESFAEAMAQGISLIAGITDIDRMSVFRNSHKPDGLYLSQLYRWEKKAGGTTEVIKRFTGISYASIFPGWEKTLAAGGCISGLVRLMPEADILAQFGCVTILVIPVLNNGFFWGFALFDKPREKMFTEYETEVLRSASIMLTNAVTRNEEAVIIRQANEYVKLMLDASPFGCLLWDSNGKPIDCNEALLKMLETTDKCSVLERFFDYALAYQHDGQQAQEKAFAMLNKTAVEGRCVFEWTHQSKNGTPIPAEITLTRIERGSSYIIAGYTRDLREHQRMMLEIEKQNNLLRAVNRISNILLQSDSSSFDSDLLHSMGIMAEGADIDRVYLWKNHIRDGQRYCSQLYEWSPDVASQQHYSLAVETSYKEAAPEWEEKLSRGQCINGIVRELSANEQAALSPQGILSILAVPIFLKGAFWGFIGFDDCVNERVFTKNEEIILRSASELIAEALVRKDMEENLRASAVRLQNALTEAQSASRAKGDFLSRMSHEMRTPMNAIIGMTAIARGTGDLEKKEYCLDKIDNASTHLLSVINDILDMSKIEANKLDLSPHPFNFENMLINITNVLNFRVEEKNQKFIVAIDENIPVNVTGDELRLTQIITNLLTNAVKFTPEGGSITLNAKCLESSDNTSNILVEVIDTGIGISAEQQSRLFTAFEQAESGTARKFGGTGLGLAISKRIVEMMNGSIWLESEHGRGSKFAFTVTLQKNGKETLLPRIDRNSVEILAVDDAPEIREYFKEIMRRFGFSCDTAADGEEALQMIQRKKGRHYNIFFVDWIMVKMDGVELSRRIKKITRDNSVIIMISGAEWNKIADRGKKAGISRFISKPLFPSVLLNTIESCIRQEPPAPKAAGIKPVSSFAGRRILIAEDIEINREIIAAILEETDINIDFAKNGREAVQLFTDNPGKYNLILMDVQMPEMDGYNATRNIRSLPRREALTIPIIAMTANVFREDIEACLAAGMNDHLGKPIDMDLLFEKLRCYL